MLMGPRDIILRLLPNRNELIDELAGRLTISEARWDGDPQTIVHIDRLLPTLAVPRGVESEADDDARWRVLTAKPPHLYGFRAPSDALKEFKALGLRKGPSSKHGGYRGRDYYELST